MMQVAGVARRASRALRSSLSITPHRCFFLSSFFSYDTSPPLFHSRSFHTFSLPHSNSSGCCNGGVVITRDWLSHLRNLKCSMTFVASLCSALDSNSTVNDVYDKMVESIKVKRSAPPNAWLWSLIEKCRTQDDIKLLFQMLHQLRIFRLSNLRIHDNFNCNLCQEVTKACIRAGAVDFGKKVLWKHNIYGLTPTVGSANQLLSYAKIHKDVKLMEDIMSLIRHNNLPLQPATADIIFSICYDVDTWGLISKYSKRFLNAGVKLRKTTFDVWMEFASRRERLVLLYRKMERAMAQFREPIHLQLNNLYMSDVESLWKIEKMRSETYNQHTIKSALSCAKGFLLEGDPESAATVIQVVNQTFPDSKRQDIITELQKLVSEWPVEVVKQEEEEEEEDQKALVASLKADIPAMISSLSTMGVASSVKLEDLNKVDHYHVKAAC